MLISQCDGLGCFDEHINFKSSIAGDSCNLRPASESSLYLYLVFITLTGQMRGQAEFYSDPS
jgi:hypothetical protein